MEINETVNIKEIKSAYAKRSKEIHPEEQPKEFQGLCDSYQAAISYARMFGKTEVSCQQESNIEIETNLKQLFNEAKVGTLNEQFNKLDNTQKNQYNKKELFGQFDNGLRLDT